MEIGQRWKALVVMGVVAGAGCQLPCASGEVRRGDRCARTCNSDMDCTRAESCIDGSCQPTEETADAGAGSSSSRDTTVSSSTSAGVSSSAGSSSSAAPSSAGQTSSSSDAASSTSLEPVDGDPPEVQFTAPPNEYGSVLPTLAVGQRAHFQANIFHAAGYRGTDWDVECGWQGGEAEGTPCEMNCLAGGAGTGGFCDIQRVFTEPGNHRIVLTVRNTGRSSIRKTLAFRVAAAANIPKLEWLTPATDGAGHATEVLPYGVPYQFQVRIADDSETLSLPWLRVTTTFLPDEVEVLQAESCGGSAARWDCTFTHTFAETGDVWIMAGVSDAEGNVGMTGLLAGVWPTLEEPGDPPQLVIDTPYLEAGSMLASAPAGAPLEFGFHVTHVEGVSSWSMTCRAEPLTPLASRPDCLIQCSDTQPTLAACRADFSSVEAGTYLVTLGVSNFGGGSLTRPVMVNVVAGSIPVVTWRSPAPGSGGAGPAVGTHVQLDLAVEFSDSAPMEPLTGRVLVLLPDGTTDLATPDACVTGSGISTCHFAYLFRDPGAATLVASVHNEAGAVGVALLDVTVSP